MTTPASSSTSRVPARIDCETAVRRLWDYLDNRLPAASYAEVEAHIATCLLCPPHFTFAQSMQRALAESAPEQTTDEQVVLADRLRERVCRALRAEQSLSSVVRTDAPENES